MSEKRAIEKMVKWLEVRENRKDFFGYETAYSFFLCAIKEARRLALEEAKEKPAADLWGQHKAMIKLAQDHGLNLAANWAVNMSGKTFSEKPTAPASLSPWRALDHLRRHKHPNHEGNFLYAPDVYNELSRYRPTPTKDIVGELKKSLGSCPYCQQARKIIHKYSGEK